MPGTRAGGVKAKSTILERYGAGFYSRLAAAGGRKGTTGGFASEEVGSDGLTGRERARLAGKKGATAPKRNKKS